MDDQIYQSLKHIEDLLSLLVLEKKDAIMGKLLEVFGNSEQRAKVYMEVDGRQTGKEIASKIGIYQPDVSGHLKSLAQSNIVRAVAKMGRGSIYAKNEAFEIIGLTEKVREKFGLPLESVQS